MKYKKNYSTEKNEGKCIMKENWSSKSTLAKKKNKETSETLMSLLIITL